MSLMQDAYPSHVASHAALETQVYSQPPQVRDPIIVIILICILYIYIFLCIYL